jgi:hypothetical protein
VDFEHCKLNLKQQCNAGAVNNEVCCKKFIWLYSLWPLHLLPVLPAVYHYCSKCRGKVVTQKNAASEISEREGGR